MRVRVCMYTHPPLHTTLAARSLCPLPPGPHRGLGGSYVGRHVSLDFVHVRRSEDNDYTGGRSVPLTGMDNVRACQDWRKPQHGNHLLGCIFLRTMRHHICVAALVISRCEHDKSSGDSALAKTLIPSGIMVRGHLRPAEAYTSTCLRSDQEARIAIARLAQPWSWAVLHQHAHPVYTIAARRKHSRGAIASHHRNGTLSRASRVPGSFKGCVSKFFFNPIVETAGKTTSNLHASGAEHTQCKSLLIACKGP